MPNVLSADDSALERSGEGWKVFMLADAQTFGEPAMIARRWVFDPGAEGPSTKHGSYDQLLYVIKGSGQAVVDEQTFPLDTESVLWLEPGETYHFVAGPEGLEILQGYAPGE